MSTLAMNLCKCLSLTEEAIQAKKQGIGTTILSFHDFDQKLKASSPRTSISSSMSSSWMSELLGLPCTAGGQPLCRREEEMKHDDDEKMEGEKAKKKEETEDAVTYIHPQVRKSENSLSIKSLDVCTESLGSETGSDDFSPSPPSEKIDGMSYVEQDVITDGANRDYSFAPLPANKKTPTRAFPPPIPYRYCSGSSWQTRSHRNGGRLVLEVISTGLVQNYFHARRSDGRLVLTLNGDAMEEVVPVPETQKQYSGSEIEEAHMAVKSFQEDDDDTREKGTKTNSKDIGEIDKQLWVFCNKFKFFEVEHDKGFAVAQSVPPWPSETMDASLFLAPMINKEPWPIAHFECCWKPEAMLTCLIGDYKLVLFEDIKLNNGHRMIAWRGKKEYFVDPISWVPEGEKEAFFFTLVIH